MEIKRTLRRWSGALTLLAVVWSTGCASSEYAYVSCEVTSNPPSAEVWVGSQQLELESAQRDSTPCKLLFNKPGEYEITVKKPGYEAVKRLVTIVEAGTPDSPELKTHPDEMTVTLDRVEGEVTEKGGDDDGKKKPDENYYDE